MEDAYYSLSRQCHKNTARPRCLPSRLQQPIRVCMGIGLAALTMAFRTPSRVAHWNIKDGKEQKSIVK